MATNTRMAMSQLQIVAAATSAHVNALCFMRLSLSPARGTTNQQRK